MVLTEFELRTVAEISHRTDLSIEQIGKVQNLRFKL